MRSLLGIIVIPCDFLINSSLLSIGFLGYSETTDY